MALAQAAIAAMHSALDGAHPVLSAGQPGEILRDVTDAEHFAIQVLHVSDHLAELLDDYAAAYLEPDAEVIPRVLLSP